MKINKLVIFTFMSCIAGLLLRIYSLGFFEFKADQARAVILANYTRMNFFYVFHGMMSGVGVPNPPGFYWFMGLFSFFGNGPVYFALIFLLFSCLLPLLIYLLLRRSLEHKNLLITVILSAISPMLIVFSCNIWRNASCPYSQFL